MGTNCLKDPDDVVPVHVPSDTTRVEADLVTGQPHVADELLVAAKEGHDQALLAATFAANQFAIVSYDPETRFYKVRRIADPGLPPLSTGKDVIAADAEVDSVFYNDVVSPSRVPSDSWGSGWTENSPSGDNWYLEAIRAPTAWGYSTGSGGKTITVGIADFDFTLHEDLKDVVDAKFVQYTGASTWATPQHGTQVAGLMAATGNNQRYRTGVVWRADLHYCQVAGDFDRISYCLGWLVRSGAKVVNLSVARTWKDKDGNWIAPLTGDPADSADSGVKGVLTDAKSYWETKLDALVKAGYSDWVIVQAAGNESLKDARFGAFLANVTRTDLRDRIVIAGATDSSNGLACYSNRKTLDLVAPGGDNPMDTFNPLNGCAGTNQITALTGTSSISEGGFGTSFSAPLVAGTIALVRYANPSLSAPDAVRMVLDQAPAGPSGFPTLNAELAVWSAADLCVKQGGTFSTLTTGQCCTPNCAGKQCGDDGCGGTCPPLAEGETECVGDTLRSCQSSKVMEVDCAASGGNCSSVGVTGKVACIGGASSCVSSCGGRECGDDGCGNACATCGADKPFCSPDGKCSSPMNPLPTGEILTPGEGTMVTGDFPLTVKAQDDTSLVKVTVVVTNSTGVQVYKQSTYPAQAQLTWGIATVSTLGWTDGDYVIGLWALDAANPAALVAKVRVRLMKGPCTPDCTGRECGSDGCGGICLPGCAGSSWCDPVGGKCKLDSEIQALVAGAYHACAIRSDSSLWCWGQNGSGQLGDGTTLTRTFPHAVSGPEGAAVIAVDAGQSHTCAVTNDGSAWCWGSPQYGQTGDQTGNPNSLLPWKVRGLENSGVVSVALGERHSCALKQDGTVWCWGDNAMSELGGAGSLSVGSSSSAVLALPEGSVTSKMVALTAGFYNSCARGSNGSIWCWGDYYFGELGNGAVGTGSSMVGNPIPQLVSGFSGGATLVDGHYYVTCALKDEGSVWCWGQCGTVISECDSSGKQPTPIEINGFPTGVQSVALGAGHACAILLNGELWCWGSNGYGQLGRADRSTPMPPARVEGLPDGYAVRVAAGERFTCVQWSDDSIWCWGENNGSLGDGTTVSRYEPRPVVWPN